MAFIKGDMREIVPTLLGQSITLVIADPPYSTFPLINEAIDICRKYCSNATIVFFMFPIDLFWVQQEPDCLAHWIKPVSTKNTVKRYSNFVELLLFYNLQMTDKLHWSNRTGVFIDGLLTNHEHPWKKPESLIERLIGNHYPGHGVILDPFAGSKTVATVCDRLGIECISIDTVTPS